MRFFILFSSMLVTCVLNAEIVSVRIDWDNIQCQEDCAKLMDKQLNEIKQVATVSVSQTNGNATLQWKAGDKFDFQPVNNAIKRVGLHLEALRINVRGTISVENRKYFITSIGDGTKFHLLGQATDDPNKNRYVIQNSAFNRPLSKEQKEQLENAMKNDLTVTIEGPILQPYQFPPLDLIIGSLNVSGSDK